VMLANDLTGQMARERVAEFHRQAEHQRLARLARAQRRGGNRGLWRGWRLLAGSAKSFECGCQKVLERPINCSTVGDAVRSS